MYNELMDQCVHNSYHQALQATVTKVYSQVLYSEPPAFRSVLTEDYKWRQYAYKWTILSQGQLVKSVCFQHDLRQWQPDLQIAMFSTK